MAENLRFPIVFDLEKGVEAAIKDWDGKYADKLEKAIQKRALNVKLKFDTKAFDNLDDVKRRLSELKITPLTPENKTAIRDLVRELKELARIMEKIQKFKGIELPELQMAKAAKLRKDVEQANEKMRLSQERIRQSNERLILSQQRAAQQADRTSKAYGTQSGYLERLIKKMAIYASFRQVGNFLTSVREVTAQFELQRVSLGAILQDANKGEQIFSQIKQFALKSPISILDLTKYTKQLAAYKIGYDELFDTTKRLADISVGLGVDFQRLTLLYGQVRATGYLRASEVRQATEAGIPLVEELAAKLTKANGELVTAADVMDMISKRAISFDMVKDVFTDMTSAGGAFYQMQEKQGNTLYGLWAKLGDAASVMYEQIGNTGIVNEGMKEAIQMLTELMRNWKAVGLTAATSILPAVAAMAAWKMATKALAKSVATATSERIAAEAKLATAMKGTDIAAQNAARSSLAKAKADEAAAIAAQKNATAQSRLKMGFVSLGKTIASGLGIGIAVMLVTNLIYKFYEALTNFRKLKRELGSIYTETATLQDQSVRNFEFLADKAVKAASGSKEQTDTLQELNRTYRDILPQEALTIENLAKMKGNYDALTQSIREYVAEQQRQKAESAIMEHYGATIKTEMDNLRETFFDYGLSAGEVGRFFSEFQKIATGSVKKLRKEFHDALIKSGVEDEKLIAKIYKEKFGYRRSDVYTFHEDESSLYRLSEAYADQANELKGMNEQYRESIGNLGKFSDMQKRVSDTVAGATYKTTSDKPVDRDKQGDLLDAMKLNLWVKQTALEIQNNEDIKKAFAYMGEGIKSEWFNIINVLNSNDLGKVSQINFDAIIASVDSMIAKLSNKNPEILAILNTFRNYLVAQKKEYENMVPSDLVVNRWRSAWRTIANEVGISRQYMNRFLMQSGEDFEAYRKKIKEELTATINNLRVLQEAIAKTGVGKKMIPGMWRPGTDQFKNNEEYYKAQEAEKKAEALKKLLDELDKIELETGKEKKGSKGSKSDTRLQVLQEVAQTLATINKEYDDLAKKEGASKALADIKEQFKEVLAYTNKIGGKFGLNFDFPTEFKTLQEDRNAILKVMQSLKGLPKGSEKTILDFKTMIGKADSDYLQKQIEKQLKELSDRISRTKTAKEFYEKILKSTGDANLALNLTTSIYGEDGQDLKKQAAQQVKRIFSEWKIDMPLGIVDESDNIDYKALREFAVKAKETRAIGEGVADELIKIAENGEKELSRVAQEGAKLLLKYDEIAQQRVNIEQEASEKIKALRDAEALYLASNASAEQKAAFTKRTNNAVAGVEANRDLELFKLKSEYLRYFSAIHSLTNKEANYVRDTFRKALFDAFRKGAISADKFKKEMAALNEQFDKLLDTSSLAMNFMSGGFDGLINKVKEMADEVENVGLEISRMRNKDGGTVMKIEDFSQGQKDYMDKMLKLFGNENTGNSFQSFFDKMGGDSSKMGEMFNKMGQDMKAGAGKMASAVAMVDMIIQMVNATIKGIAQIRDQLNEMRSEDNQLGGTFWDAFEYLENFNKYAYSGWEKLKSGDFVGASFDTVSSIISIFGTEQAQRIKRINKRIKEQQKLLEQLEYTYGRLEKAADKAFGADYVANQKQQQKILLAQQQAYMKQYEAEMSKGKKADEEKAQEFLDKARDVGDQIADMQGKIAEHMAGTDVASAARDFANAWLEAYAAFGNTTDAIKEKFNDMIKNMIVESVMAKTVQMALQPMFDEMDRMYKSGASMTDVLTYAFSQAGTLTDQISNGLEVNAKYLESLGINIRDLYSSSDNLKGIAKDIGSASSEEINAAAAIGNTLLYYVSPIPRIDENLARVVALMEGKTSVLPTASGATSGAVDYTEMFTTANQHLSSLPRMEQHLAEIHTMLGRALRTKGSTTGFNTFLNS